MNLNEIKLQLKLLIQEVESNHSSLNVTEPET